MTDQEEKQDQQDHLVKRVKQVCKALLGILEHPVKKVTKALLDV